MASPPPSYRIADGFIIREPPESGYLGWPRISSDLRCGVTETLLPLRRGQARMRDMKFLLSSTMDPVYYKVYLPKFLMISMSGIDSAKNHQKVIRWGWKNAVLNIIRPIAQGTAMSASENLAKWSSTLRYLIERGADISQPTDIYYMHNEEGSAYLNILLRAKSPAEAAEHTHAWLSFLKSCGVPIGPYIKRETPDIYRGLESEDLPQIWPKRPVAVGFEGIPVPCWEWKIGPREEVSELWKVFQGLIPQRHPFGLKLSRPSSPGDYKVWLRSAASDRSRSRSFPYMPAMLDHTDWGGDIFRGYTVLCRVVRLALKITGGRFARREARKWRRAHPKGETTNTDDARNVGGPTGTSSPDLRRRFSRRLPWSDSGAGGASSWRSQISGCSWVVIVVWYCLVWKFPQGRRKKVARVVNVKIGKPMSWNLEHFRKYDDGSSATNTLHLTDSSDPGHTLLLLRIKSDPFSQAT